MRTYYMGDIEKLHKVQESTTERFPRMVLISDKELKDLFSKACLDAAVVIKRDIEVLFWKGFRYFCLLFCLLAALLSAPELIELLKGLF